MTSRESSSSPRRSASRSPAGAKGKASRSTAPARRGSTRAAPAGRRRPPKRRSILWRWRRPLFLAGLLSVAGCAGFAFVLLSIDLPPEDVLRQTSFVCASDVTEECGPDNALASFSAEEDRINVTLDRVPTVLVDAVLATEDKDFFRHQGIDPVGIGRALYTDLRARSAQQGGSTITQQYVKNVYLTSERSVVRKLKEAVLAVKLERELSKEQILERYLNTIYFGRGAYGVGAASRAYFNKDVRQLQLPEAAYLAGLIRAPERADVERAPDEARRRRATVLDAMLRDGRITVAERDEADEAPFEGMVIPRRDRRGLGPVRGREIGSEYFVAMVRDQMIRRYGEDLLYGGGLRIYTTLDLDMQAAAWDAITEVLDGEDDPSAALVAVDDAGHVRAMVGGTDFATSQVNLAIGRTGGGSGRQAGSAFKPFVLAEAVDQGISLESRFNAPGTMVFPGANAGADWRVSNYGGTEQGVLDLIEATRVSSNTAYAQLMLEVGPEAVVDMANRMGITADLPAVPALSLGSGEVSVLDMAVAYSTLANRGVRRGPVTITRVEQVSETGRVSLLEATNPTEDRVLAESEADLVTHALRQVVLGGTGSAASFGKPAAGKTGTTQDNRDAWFVGYTPRLTAAVWMGYPGKPGEPTRFMSSVRGQSVTGGSFPAQIWRRFMVDATAGMDTGQFVAPSSFPGRLLNEALTTTTEAPATTTATTDPAETTTTTEDPEVTTTTEPDATTTTSSTEAPATTTTTAAPTTTTTAGGGGGGGGPPTVPAP
jgi:penicillin-binding protein 1A